MEQEKGKVEDGRDRKVVLRWGGEVDIKPCGVKGPIKSDIDGFINNFEALGYVNCYFDQKALQFFIEEILSGKALVAEGDKRLECHEGVWTAYNFENSFEAIGFLDYSCGPTRVEKIRYGLISTLPEQLRPKTRPIRKVEEK